MTNKPNIQQDIIRQLGLESSSEEVQNGVIQEITIIAQQRIGLAAPELLNDNQVKALEKKLDDKITIDELVQWIQEQIPNYDDLFISAVQDIADSMAKRQDALNS